MRGLAASSPTGYPVLVGLEKASVAGKTIAGIAGVSASTVSKWRTGASIMPATTSVFLTLVLASLIEDMEALERRLAEQGCAWNDGFDDQRRELQALLRAQEAYNAANPPHVVRAGAGMFRHWLDKNDGMSGAMMNRHDYGVTGGADGQPVVPGAAPGAVPAAD